MINMESIDTSLLCAAAWLAIGICGVARPHSMSLASRILYPAVARVPHCSG